MASPLHPSTMDYLDVSTMQRIAPQDPRLPVVFKQLVQRYQLSQGRLQLFRQTHNVLNRVSHQYVPGTPVKVGLWRQAPCSHHAYVPACRGTWGCCTERAAA